MERKKGYWPKKRLKRPTLDTLRKTVTFLIIYKTRGKEFGREARDIRGSGRP